MTTAGRAGVAGGALGRTSHMEISSTSKEKGRDTFAFSIAEGMLANVSINGGCQGVLGGAHASLVQESVRHIEGTGGLPSPSACAGSTVVRCAVAAGAA